MKNTLGGEYNIDILVNNIVGGFYKKVLKSKLFIILLTAIICVSGSVFATTLYYSNQISYLPEDTNWNVSNVEDALNDLYVASNSGGTYTIKVNWVAQYATGDFLTVEIQNQEGEKVFNYTRPVKNSYGYLMDS